MYSQDLYSPPPPTNIPSADNFQPKDNPFWPFRLLGSIRKDAHRATQRTFHCRRGITRRQANMWRHQYRLPDLRTLSASCGTRKDATICRYITHRRTEMLHPLRWQNGSSDVNTGRRRTSDRLTSMLPGLGGDGQGINDVGRTKEADRSLRY